MACKLHPIKSNIVGYNIHKSDRELVRSTLSRDIHKRVGLTRRSYYYNHLICSTGGIKASPLQPKLKNFPSADETEDEDEIEVDDKGKKRANWIERLMELPNCWKGKEDKDREYISIDRAAFSSLLREVSWSDTKLLSQLAFLCNMAYVIPDIKMGDLRRYYGLKFVISSLEKKAEAAAIRDKVEHDSSSVPVASSEVTDSTSKSAETSDRKPQLEEGMFLQNEDDHESKISSRQVYKSETAAFVASSTMTAVVAAGEKQKEEAARDLESLKSLPCEWFICDDSSIYTRCFVIQGSDSLASWQANLFFETTKFEGTDASVHRGIYEAAKGLYSQLLSEIRQHLNRHGSRAKLQFTGHSLGGSLALLVHLMLLTRNEVKPSALLPAVNFGSPFVFCGSHKILDTLNLDETQIHCVVMHRDIVPRAFSCKYPEYVARVLKRLSRMLWFHSCLNKNVSTLALSILAVIQRLSSNFHSKNKLLYFPMGKLFILQPNENSSPPHPLLPPGSGLYVLDNAKSSLNKNAIRAFLNSPHPIQILSDPTAYGSNGTITRDHDSSNYLKGINEIIRQHKSVIVRKPRKQRNQM